MLASSFLTLQYVIWNCLLCKVISRVIQPSISNSSGEFYMSLLDIQGNFQGGEITCGMPYCYIFCNGPKGCYQITVNATVSVELLVECNAVESCKNINIYGSSLATSIYCRDQNACSAAYIHVDQTDTVNLQCDWGKTIYIPGSRSYLRDGTCTDLQLYADYATTVTVYCNQYDCTSIQLNVREVDTATIDLMYDGAHLLQVYGSNIKTSLNVGCLGGYSCSESNIYCPGGNGVCSINCYGTWSCKNTDIYVGDIYANLVLADVYPMYVPDNAPGIYNGGTVGILNTHIHCQDDAYALYSSLFYNITSKKFKCITNECCPITILDTKSPASNSSTSNSPTSNPPTSNPTTVDPTTSNPTSAIPVSSNPTTSNSATSNSATFNFKTTTKTKSSRFVVALIIIILLSIVILVGIIYVYSKRKQFNVMNHSFKIIQIESVTEGFGESKTYVAKTNIRAEGC